MPDVVELAKTNIAILSADYSVLEKLSKELYYQLLSRKRYIPLYFDFREFDIPAVLEDEEKEKLCLLPLLLTQKLYGLTVDAEIIKPDSALIEKYRQLLESFNSDIDEEKEYIVILYALDKASYLSEAIYQSWELGAYKNVRIVVMCSNESGG